MAQLERKVKEAGTGLQVTLMKTKNNQDYEIRSSRGIPI